MSDLELWRLGDLEKSHKERRIEAVISFLDDEHDERVRTLWAALEDNFGLQGIYGTPFPHFSYHGAEGYEQTYVRRLLEQVAHETEPFVVHTSGFGVFTGPAPVLYLPVVRAPALATCHQALWAGLSSLAENPNVYYHPTYWVPHITLAYSDLTYELLPQVIRFLSEQDTNWDLEVANLSLAYVEGPDQGIRFTLPFREEEADDADADDDAAADDAAAAETTEHDDDCA
ncbi:MAG: 2'-5' RNA ligase family protein [Trueperaceae bacterium]|nr:2'-5' RNA ligase family protein [Trueperaceae bacterium]